VLTQSSHKTPAGVLYLVAREHVLLAAGFRSFGDLHQRMDDSEFAVGIKDVKSIPIISELVGNYFDGDLSALNGITVRQPGSEFSQAVWKAMRKIPAGKTWSYSDLAKKIGSPAAVRAVGTACGKNLIAPIIPCHRVVKSGGAIGNYGYGVETKELLLRHEGVLE
jgi:methylated-DNA-[protein]-cysteine S-methyltransferase